jgi:hypothetical protein
MIDINLTSLIALYGAILSSILLGWSIYRDLSDRGKLKVYCFIGKEAIPGVRKSEKSWFFYVVTNTGKRPVYVTNIGGRYKKYNGSKYTDFSISSFRKQKLEPGEEVIEKCELSVINEPITNLFAIDSLNKVYEVRRKNLKKVINDLNRKMKESSNG